MYKDQGVTVIGIAADEDDTAAVVQQFVDQTGVTFDVGNALDDSDVTFRNAAANGISPYPLQVLLDGDGTVRFLSREFDYSALEDAIDQVLAE